MIIWLMKRLNNIFKNAYRRLNISVTQAAEARHKDHDGKVDPDHTHCIGATSTSWVAIVEIPGDREQMIGKVGGW